MFWKNLGLNVCAMMSQNQFLPVPFPVLRRIIFEQWEFLEPDVVKVKFVKFIFPTRYQTSQRMSGIYKSQGRIVLCGNYRMG